MVAGRTLIGSHQSGVFLKIILLAVLGAISANPAFAWLAEGHEIIAIIAADNLTPVAKTRVAQILRVHTGSIAQAMAAASIRPDTEFRADTATPPWCCCGHFTIQMSEASQRTRYPCQRRMRFPAVHRPHQSPGRSWLERTGLVVDVRVTKVWSDRLQLVIPVSEKNGTQSA